jgi:hypothetical protein
MIHGSEHIRATVECFNKGRVQATNFTVTGRMIRTVRPISGGGEEISTRSRTVRKGMGHEFTKMSDYMLSDQALADSTAWNQRLFFVGLIQYQSEGGGTEGQTGFCRRWNSQTQEWDETDFSDLEFEL